MARIVTVYRMWRRRFRPVDMSYIRWLKISEGLAQLGHNVDIATNEPRWIVRRSPLQLSPHLRRVPLARVRWSEYDVVKTLFNKGFETLEHYGGDTHPFIIAKLGSVVGPRDMPGIYFHGAEREDLFANQQRVHVRSRYVTVLSSPARQLWAECFGAAARALIVPGAADDQIPPAGRDPYGAKTHIRCLFAGTVYGPRVQPEAHRTIIDKLNALGRALSARGARLYMCGVGDVSRLDRTHVSYLGRIAYERTWDYFRHADVGCVVSAGAFMHNNESSKIYHYLRAGLPVVSEAGFPNDDVVREAQCGVVVAGPDMEAFADAVVETARTDWDRDRAIRYILSHHTWSHRVKIYDELLRRECN